MIHPTILILLSTIASLLVLSSSSASAGIIGLERGNVSNIASLNDVFSDEELAQALASVNLVSDDLSDGFLASSLELDVVEGGALGSLNDAKMFDLEIPENSFVTIKFGPNVALVTDMGGDGIESFDFEEILGRTPAPGLSNYRVFTGRTPSNPIPEPSGVLLMSAGFGVVVVARRRRKLA